MHRAASGQQRDDAADVGEPVQAEAPGRAELGQRQPAEHRSDDARQVELDRVQRDGVREMLPGAPARESAPGRPARRRPAPAPRRTTASGCARPGPRRARTVRPAETRSSSARFASRCSSWRRSTRSAMTPPARENRKIGISPRNASSPSRNGEPESCSTSQLWASFCIQVPMLEVQAPAHISRKSRDSKARKVRLSKPAPRLRQRLRAVDQVQDVAVAIGEEHQAIALDLERLAEEGHALALQLGVGAVEIRPPRPPDGASPASSSSWRRDRPPTE